MTRKHFVLLAAALRTTHPNILGVDGPAARRTWRLSCRNVADACQESNRSFDRSKFLAACVPFGFDSFDDASAEG